MSSVREGHRSRSDRVVRDVVTAPVNERGLWAVWEGTRKEELQTWRGAIALRLINGNMDATGE